MELKRRTINVRLVSPHLYPALYSAQYISGSREYRKWGLLKIYNGRRIREPILIRCVQKFRTVWFIRQLTVGLQTFRFVLRSVRANSNPKTANNVFRQNQSRHGAGYKAQRSLGERIDHELLSKKSTQGWPICLQSLPNCGPSISWESRRLQFGSVHNNGSSVLIE